MPDPTMIGAALTSVKTALDIAKLIRESNTSLERAELNLRLAELVGALADAKIELAQVQDVISLKDERISELESAFEKRNAVARLHDAMYELGPSGGTIGNPYCLRCWEAERKLRPLSTSAISHRVRECNFCKSSFNSMRAPRLAEEQPPAT